MVTSFGLVARVTLQMASIIVLARLLGPDDYGIVAMAMLVVSFAEVFRDFGLSAAAVQASLVTVGQRTNLFWANTALGGLMTLMAILLSPALATFFDEPLLAPVASSLAAVLLINGVSAQYRADLTRRMKFGWLAAGDVIGQLLGLTVGIALALNGAGYWSLVAMTITQAGTALVILVVAGGWLPGFPNKSERITEFLRFGWNLVATQLVGYAANNADTAILGYRYSTATLGIYDRAYKLLNVPLAQIRSPATTVALPVLSKLKDDSERFTRFLLRGQVILGYTVVVGLGFIAGTSSLIVPIALGPQWTEVIPVLTVLAVAGALQTLAFVGYWVYLSKALTGALLRYSLVSATVKVLFIWIGSSWGPIGVAAGVAAASAVMWPVSLWWLTRLSGLPLGQLWLGAMRVLATATIVGSASAVAAVGIDAPPVVALLGAVVAGLVVYVLVGLLYRPIGRDQVELLHTIRAAVGSSPPGGGLSSSTGETKEPAEG